MQNNYVEGKPSCPECGDKLVGRSDKKFCSDYCRSSYFNKIHADQNHFMRHINRILRKNRRILHELYQNGITCPSQAVLSGHGFMFSYFTGEKTLQPGQTFRYCYDYGYHLHDKKEICELIHDPEIMTVNFTI
jgi:hypothetical protein